MRRLSEDIEKILIDEVKIKQTVRNLGQQIQKDFEKSENKLLMIGILKGSVVFMSDLIREIDLPLSVDFMQVSSYGSGTVTSGDVNLSLDLRIEDLNGYDVVVIEDILDTGNTLSYLLNHLKAKGANCVKLCVLLNKPERRKTKINIDYEGIIIPDEFVVGYGLDFNENYRNLPYIGVLKHDIYA